VHGQTDRGLIDTSVAIVLDALDPSLLPTELSISSVTLAELTVGPYAASELAERALRQDRLQRIEATIECLDFDPACARAFGPIYAAAQGIGRKARGARYVDLLIAATARGYGLPLYTLNGGDFAGLDGLVEVVALDQ
jgi:predicted nucleic acid-binding protein